MTKKASNATILDYVKSVVEEVTEINRARLNIDEPLEAYGINSTMIFSLNTVLQRRFDDLPRTLFFEYKTIAELAGYFAEHHASEFAESIANVASHNSEEARPVAQPIAAPAPVFSPADSGADDNWFDDIPLPHLQGASNPQPMDIAIIGVAGRYPGARHLRDFWSVLYNSRDCVTEVPAARWNHSAIYNADTEAENKVFAKWGAFIDDYDGFDNRFFNISPKEAKKMDPQERLFLQTAWNAFEDAGYTRAQLSGAKVGVYVGAMWSQYQLHAAERCSLNNLEAANSSFSSIANRVSYFLNLHGPSIALDTMCSSSISAIHMACQSLLCGESSMALAGGVNICSHPAKYIHLCDGKFAATDGRCRAFGDGGTGYVPGEGVGAVLLKPLQQALDDGDVIHGVIKATALNHGGKTNGYTVPNPVAQSAVVRSALTRSGVPAEDISVIETHGTGTSLGDPIEIAGLLSAFGDDFNPRTNCIIGSVKSNIGHLESAAGIAGLTKLLLQMRHQTLVPSLHSQVLNKNIDWHKVPFTVQQKIEPWRSKSTQPVYAALSAFGAGGSNGHLILASHPAPVRAPSHTPQLLVISATNLNSLTQMCRDLAAELRSEPSISLADVAYTLQVGRELFSQRVALQAHSVEQAVQELEQVAQALEDGAKDARIALVQESVFTDLLQGDAGHKFVQQLFSSGDLATLARLWLGGSQIDWHQLYVNSNAAQTPRRVSLPGYVFDTRSFNFGAPLWLDASATVAAPGEPAVIAAGHMTINQQVWRASELNAVTTALPVRGIIISHPETQAVAQQLRMQPAFKQFEIIYPEEINLEEFFASLQLARNDSFAVVHLWGDVFDTAENAVTQEESYAVEQMLKLRTLLQTRCALRYLWVNLGTAVRNTATAKLARGFTTALCGEYKQLAAASLDTDAQGPQACVTIAAVWQSFAVAQQYREANGKIEVLSLEPCAPLAGEVQVAADKYHLITGGTGGIGLQIAEWLVRRGAQHIVLCGRQALPDRSAWASLVNSPSTPSALRTKLRGLLQLPATVKTAVLDLEQPMQVANFLRDLKQERELGYVFHCAGIADEQTPLFAAKTRASIAQVLSPKVQGTEHLLAALRQSECEQLVLISSLSAVCPRLSAGLVDYAVANSYLNSIAHEQPRVAQQSNRKVVSVLMPNWREVGLGETASPHYVKLGLKSVSNQEGIQLLQQSMLSGSPVVLPLYVNDDFQLAAIAQQDALPEVHKPVAARAEAPLPVASATPVQVPVTDVKTAVTVSAAQVMQDLKLHLAPVLGMTAAEWGDGDEFAALGVDSVLLASLATQIEKWLALPFSADILLSYTNIAALANYLLREHRPALDATYLECAPDVDVPEVITPATRQASAEVAAPAAAPTVMAAQSAPVIAPVLSERVLPVTTNEPIAIVGMGAIFPDAADIHAYWDNLRNGHSAIGEVPASRWDINSIFNPAGAQGESISKWGGFVEGVEYFSPSQFGLPDEIGADADPLLRLAMRATDAALRDAGISAADINGGNVGVFIGSRVSTYSERIREYNKNTLLGTAQNFIAAHISHWLNLRGPALVLDSACSSSLLSVHLACQSLRDGECDIALAGGSEYLLDETPYQMLSQAKALSPTGQCRTFDADADGFVPGEGAGVVVLKKLSQALIDGDRIYALVSGSAVNNDGRTMGVTTPNPDAQQAVIRKALAKAGFSAQDLGYVEAHGTGTRLGDPMELKALTQVFRESTERRSYCAIGSVKSNMGHLLSAAGVASVIKVALSVFHKTLVPTLNCATPNPRFNFAESPFYPSRETQPWQSADNHCRAGISAFGFGGTNVHLLLSDMHLAQAYAPVKAPLPLVPNSGAYLWHPKSSPRAATIAPASREPLPVSAEQKTHSGTGFNWKRTA